MFMLYICEHVVYSGPITGHRGIQQPSLLPADNGSSKPSKRSEGKHFLPELLPRRRSLLQGEAILIKIPLPL